VLVLEVYCYTSTEGQQTWHQRGAPRSHAQQLGLQQASSAGATHQCPQAFFMEGLALQPPEQVPALAGREGQVYIGAIL